LAQDLRRFLSGEAIHARPAGSLERVVKWARRHPRLAMVATFVVLMALVGVAATVLAVVRIATG
jgi:hypothetical protein